MSFFSRFANRERTSPQRKHARIVVKPMRRERESEFREPSAEEVDRIRFALAQRRFDMDGKGGGEA
ncbi:hypothetical protein [Rhodanobacter lindaniclasticus]|uniref:hypothetical protein n=1 Tax=Rhodanobacter lindaniclasticus TaxID=75310 RepID=UPI00109EFBDB|nr:hypothetical protein [Rhodanobacter lindaniclasticus]